MEDPLLWQHDEKEVWKPDEKTGEILLKSIPANSDAILDVKKGKSLIVIPARMASKRLPGKPLLMAGGQALLHWTYAQATQTIADHVVVATPDREIAKYCQENNITWMATAEDHPNGTSRCREIIERSKVKFDRIINWQVDEPCVSAAAVNELIGMKTAVVGTFVFPVCPDPEDSNAIKVVHSNKRCHWFSRAPMRRAGLHIGIYSFSHFQFDFVASLEPTILAGAESLEQLSWIEHGVHIEPFIVAECPISVNTMKDWERFKQLVED